MTNVIERRKHAEAERSSASTELKITPVCLDAVIIETSQPSRDAFRSKTLENSTSDYHESRTDRVDFDETIR